MPTTSGNEHYTIPWFWQALHSQGSSSPLGHPACDETRWHRDDSNGHPATWSLNDHAISNSKLNMAWSP